MSNRITEEREYLEYLINLKPKKRRFMGWFKRKKKPIKRTVGDGFYQRKATEQEYVDEQFNSIRVELKAIRKYRERSNEEIEILKSLNDKEHILICQQAGLAYEKVTLPESLDNTDPEVCRKWAREQGYYYVKQFENRGELWVKDEKKANT